MKIIVQYFALLREERGCAGEEIETTAPTALALYDELRKLHGLSMPVGSMKVAIKDEFVSWEAPLADRDTVSFLPPVAGG
jgi:molybdopterin converting factor small subunit